MNEQDFEKVPHGMDELSLLYFVANLLYRWEQEREDITLRARTSEELDCTCDACLDIIRKKIEDAKSRPYPNGRKD